ncbi:PIN domain-like protein [Halteromyces radiatus]|uniref:PIN domain-like protein n=1 Tax=Halteromyces radiatus TaxID=101107 RepID=UPI00221E6E64|nr:PIN domain-like protein [Halteromyces radiatus]KAI8097339.1 PIN domain-like protein [Halteromyces radiatus]
MGINGLTGLLKRHAPQSLTRVLAQQFQGQTLAIDASCPLNRFIYGSQDEPHPYRHIHGFYLLAKFCDRHNIKPIFVFDGTQRLVAKQEWEHRRRQRGRYKIKHSLVFEQSRSVRLATWLATTESRCLSMLTSESIERLLNQLGTTRMEHEVDTLNPGYVQQEQDVLEAKWTQLAKELYDTRQRVQDKEKYTKTVRDLSNQEYDLMCSMIRHRLDSVFGDLQELKLQNERLLTSYGKRALRVTQEMKDQCQFFLSTMGYTCMTCENHEAEAMCARLVEDGKADAIVSEDMDSVVFGDSRLLRYFFVQHRPILCVDPVVARQQMGLSKAEFLDLCILCGTDFGSKIHGVGPIRALEMIKQFGSIEQILYHLDPRKYIPEEGFDFRLIRKIFQELPDTISLDTLPSPTVDSTKLGELLQKYEIDVDEMDRQLDMIIQQQYHSGYEQQLDQKQPLTDDSGTIGDNGFGNDPFQQRHPMLHLV